jgi:chorismate lyase
VSFNLRAAKPRHVPRHERWFDTTSTRWLTVPRHARDWLDWPESLTQRIAHHLGQPVLVRVLSERCDRLLPEERALLGVAGRSGRVREVQLDVGGQTYVVARTVFADAAARGANRGLRELGNRALGSLLFTSMRAPVAIRQFAALTPRSSLWHVLHKALPPCEHPLWARRAVHTLRAQPLVVTEIFLPQLLESHRHSPPRSASRASHLLAGNERQLADSALSG